MQLVKHTKIIMPISYYRGCLIHALANACDQHQNAFQLHLRILKILLTQTEQTEPIHRTAIQVKTTNGTFTASYFLATYR